MMAVGIQALPTLVAAAQSDGVGGALCCVVVFGLGAWGGIVWLNKLNAQWKAAQQARSGVQPTAASSPAAPSPDASTISLRFETASAPKLSPGLEVRIPDEPQPEVRHTPQVHASTASAPATPRVEPAPASKLIELPPHVERAPTVEATPRQDSAASTAPARVIEPAATPTLWPPVAGKTEWIPPGQSIAVAGYTLKDGMVYVGGRLRAVNAPGTEPALINPRLEVASRPNRDGKGMKYWPSYSDISPASRAGYLEWLASGRRNPTAYIGYVFLFFYGLERRALIELGTDPAALAEARLIEDEVQRLLEIHAENGSFRSYASAFLDVLRVRRTGEDGLLKEVPQFTLRHAGAASFDVRVAAGTAATKGLPLPADWALAWAVEASDTKLRTPAIRCPEEFQALFHARYQRDHGAGIIPRAKKSQVEARYQPASASFAGMVRLVSTSVSEASETSLKPVRELIEDCCESLESYSRWVGKNPEARNSMSALALLPPELTTSMEGGSDVQALRALLREALGSKPSAPVAATEMLKHWPTATSGKLSRSEAVGLAQALEKLGYGMEPDPRMGGALLSADESAQLFALPPDSPSAPTPSYLSALAMLHLAAAVATADGVVSLDEVTRMEALVEAAQGLLASEKARLRAHVAWLLTRPASSAGHKKRVEALTPEARTSLGNLLVEVAVADGSVSPQEIKTLSKLYAMLGLDESTVYSRVHAATAPRPTAATEPVPMRLAGAPEKGFDIPAPPPEKNERLALDMRTVQAKLAETAAVSSLLGSIFADEEAPPPPAPTPPPTTEAGVAGLDALHTSLLRALVAKPEWPRPEVEKLASGLGLLPEGALDVINDAAFEVCGEPLIEGDETLQLNEQAVKEMMS
ncbi:tellurite resistance TerB family protein [Myxococcus landrumensis]|uniref:TerB N-terminal domain-containing protein n=1 Tax=Myxococcus landrumensis TaxID=2813577 RepID=A0ABX7N6W8_9BACT|nr:TerB N-terminal domain-containing protein [Myxococcus landrumus]QSQ14169.1 TerB N-terminal domain-containing protein [Myxococcus landrumus]